MSKEEILSLITGEFSKLNDRMEKLEKFFPTVKNRPKRAKRTKQQEYIMKSLKDDLK